MTHSTKTRPTASNTDEHSVVSTEQGRTDRLPWQFVFVLTMIALGLLGIILKAVGIF